MKGTGGFVAGREKATQGWAHPCAQNVAHVSRTLQQRIAKAGRKVLQGSYSPQLSATKRGLGTPLSRGLVCGGTGERLSPSAKALAVPMASEDDGEYLVVTGCCRGLLLGHRLELEVKPLT